MKEGAPIPDWMPFEVKCSMCSGVRRPIAFAILRGGAVRRVPGRPFRMCRVCDMPAPSANPVPEENI